MADQPIRVHVVMAGFHPLYGGHILQMRSCLPRLRQRHIAVSVLTAAVPGQPSRETLDGVPIERLALPLLADGGTTLRMLAFGARTFFHLLARGRGSGGDWDVVHCVGTSWHVYASILAARLLGKRAIVEMVLLGDDDPDSIARLPLGRLKLAIRKLADRTVSLSSALSKAAERAGIPSERVPEIPVGVDIERFRPAVDDAERAELRRRLGLPEGVPLVVFVGALMERKGVDLVVEAWKDVRAAVPGAVFVLVGPHDLCDADRAFRIRLEENIEQYGLVDAVLLRGRVDCVEEYLRAANVFVLPSATEGLPNSILEAMASGIPPVVSPLPGIATDVIRSAAEGVVVSERTPDAFADALIALLRDSERRHRVGAAARQRVADAFSIERRVDRYVALYRSLAAGD